MAWLGGPLNGEYCPTESYLLVSQSALYWCALVPPDLVSAGDALLAFAGRDAESATLL